MWLAVIVFLLEKQFPASEPIIKAGGEKVKIKVKAGKNESFNSCPVFSCAKHLLIRLFISLKLL